MTTEFKVGDIVTRKENWKQIIGYKNLYSRPFDCGEIGKIITISSIHENCSIKIEFERDGTKDVWICAAETLCFADPLSHEE